MKNQGSSNSISIPHWDEFRDWRAKPIVPRTGFISDGDGFHYIEMTPEVIEALEKSGVGY